MKIVALGPCVIGPNKVHVAFRNPVGSSGDGSSGCSSYTINPASGTLTGSQDQGGYFYSAITALARANEIELFGIGTDYSVYHKYYDGSTWTSWSGLSGKMITGATVISSAFDRLEILATSKEHTIQHKWRDMFQNTWSDWETLSGHWHSSVGAVSRSSGLLDLVAISPAFEMCYKLHDKTDSRPWECLGGRFISQPVIISLDANSIDIFGLDADKYLVHKSGTGSGTEITSWTPAGTQWEIIGAFDSPPSVVSSMPNRIDICATSPSGSLYYNARVDGVWKHGTDWLLIGGGSADAAVLTSSAPGYVELWCIDTGKVWSKRLTTATDTWGDWHSYGETETASTNIPLTGCPPPYVSAYVEQGD